MKTLNIAGYKFVDLVEIDALRTSLLSTCQSLQLKGTILLSHEGINLNLAGTPSAISSFKSILSNDTRFAEMRFRESYSDTQPFKRMKVKLKKEIITMRQPNIRPVQMRAPEISPQTLKGWLDEKRDITLLDTRNDYEIEYGTFSGAVNPQIKDFCELTNFTEQLPRDKTVVMFCTGGIRCEKAALHLLNHGFSNVYQLDGGILNYFEQIGSAHYDGSCFVFDERVAIDAKLKPVV